MHVFLWFLTPLFILIYMLGVFIYAHYKNDYSLADIAWGFGFIAIALFSLLFGNRWSARSWLVTALIFLWAIRLSMHIFYRHKGEDVRYTKLRAKWGHSLVLSFIVIFLSQGFCMWLIAIPIVIINQATPVPLSFFDGLLAGAWLFGFLWEAIADYQLSIFKKEKRQGIMRTGLWRYSRHPNYFGEITQWWALWGLSIALGYAWLSIISPITITLLICFVSGVPMLEEHFKDNSEYQDYIQKTSALIPWFSKN